MKYLYIILFFLLIILIMPIKIKIYKKSKHVDVDLYFSKLLNLKLDFDKLMKKILMKNYKYHVNALNNFLYNLGIIIKSYGIVRELCKITMISKITWIYKINLKKEELEMYSMIIGWNSIAYLRNFLNNFFKGISDEYYSIQTENETVGLSFEIIINFRFIYLVYVLIKKIKDIPKIIEFHKKGSEKNV